MKYCIYCGTQIEDTALYCSNCGKKVETQVSDDETLLSNLEQCKTMLNKYQPKFDSRNRAKYELIQKPLLNGFWLFVVCLIVGFIISNALDETFWLMGIQGLGVMGTLIAIGIVFPIVILKRRKQKCIENQKTYEQLQSELRDVYDSLELPIPLAFEYCDPRIIGKLVDIVKLSRADNLKEAINCMLDDKHKAEMLNAQKNASKNSEMLSLIALSIMLNKK